MDNASNNHTLMLEIEIELIRRKIQFDHDGNRLRCFAHVLNLACQSFLTEIKNNPSTPVIESSSNIAVQEHLEDYAAQLAKDPVGNVRSIVAACRTSGQRRRDLTKTIKEGNAAGHPLLHSGSSKLRP